jgi:ribose transport system substrate-binding protein
MLSASKKLSALVAALLLAGTVAACGTEAATPAPAATSTTAAAVEPTATTAATIQETATTVIEAATATTATSAGGQCPAEVVIGWAPPDITGVFKTATDYFEKAAADATANGIKTTVISRSPATHVAFADQVAIIEDYIQRKVNVIAVSPAEVEVVKPAIAKANAAGIPVIVVNLLEPIEGIEVASYIGFDNADAASISAYAVLDYFGGPGVLGEGTKATVKPEDYLDLAWWENLYKDVDKNSIKARGAIIEGVAGGFFSAARLQGFHEVIDQYPGVEIVGSPCAADWNREKGVRCTEDILQANPSNLDFIWAASNEMGLGAMLASESAGRLETVGNLKTGDNTVAVFTNDVTPESTDRIREGKLIAETHHGFPEWGWFGTEFGVTLACGGEVPDVYDIRPRTVYQGNADQFYPNPVLPEIDWDAIKNGESPRVK